MQEKPHWSVLNWDTETEKLENESEHWTAGQRPEEKEVKKRAEKNKRNTDREKGNYDETTRK